MKNASPGTFDLYLFDDGGSRGAVTYDPRFEDVPAREGFVHERRVVLVAPEPAEEHLLPTGLPRDGLLARWREAERELLVSLDRAGLRYVKAGHVVLRASYTIVLELADTAGFDACVEPWRAAAVGGRPEVLASDGWSYFDAHVKPRGARRERK